MLSFFKALIGSVFFAALATAHGQEPQKPMQILATVFPVELATREVTKGVPNVVVTRLLSTNTGCPHDYALTLTDKRKIEVANVIVANGLGLEEFLENSIRAGGSKFKLIDLGGSLSNLIKGRKEHAAHGSKHGHSHEHDHDSEYNPHVFASPKQMAAMARFLAAELGKTDPKNGSLYQANAAAYAGRLESLHSDFVSAVGALKQKRIVTHHGVFDYLARDIGLEVVGVIQQNEGKEPSTAFLLKLGKLIKSKKVAAIFTEPQYPARYGEVLAKEAGIPIGVLDPVASGPETATPEYYETTMRGNILALKKVLMGSRVEK